MAQKARLLIVEDEEAIRSGLVDVFVYHGFEVDTAEHGTEGLNKALTGRYDLILLDVMLPGVDGFEICNRIRQQDLKQPVIMLTAKSSDDDIVQGLTLGGQSGVPVGTTAVPEPVAPSFSCGTTLRVYCRWRWPDSVGSRVIV
ncbi:MAG: response regulator, partial [Pseudomonadota bacterium]